MTQNICVIVQSPYPNDIRVYKEVQALLSGNHKVTVIALRYAGAPKQEVIGNVMVHRIGFPKKRTGILRYMLEYATFFLIAFCKLNTLDMRESFDVVHIHTLPDFLVFSAIIQKFKGRKIILDLHEIMPEFFISKFGVTWGHPMIRLLLFLERMSLRFADEVITVNEPIKQIFQKRAIPGKPITVVMNTVSASLVKKNAKVSHSGFNCVYHGSLADIYGLDIAIMGFSKICERFPDMYFHIFGSGQMLPQLKQLVENLGLQKKVIFHGSINHRKMMESLAEMDLGILTMRKDVFLDLSLSNKLAEYVYLKIPVISSDLASTKYYFRDEHIIFFKAGDVEDLGHKIEFAYRNKEKMRTIAEGAYDHFKDFGWDVMARRYLRVIEKTPDSSIELGGTA